MQSVVAQMNEHKADTVHLSFYKLYYKNSVDFGYSYFLKCEEFLLMESQELMIMKRELLKFVTNKSLLTYEGKA